MISSANFIEETNLALWNYSLQKALGTEETEFKNKSLILLIHNSMFFNSRKYMALCNLEK